VTIKARSPNVRMQDINGLSAPECGTSFVLHKLTAHLTVYDNLSSWYGSQLVTQKPRRNRLFVEPQTSADGFRVLSGINPQEEAEMQKAASGGSRASMVGCLHGEN
jgi:hypothetical protein